MSTPNKPHIRRVGDTIKVYSAVITFKDTAGVDEDATLAGTYTFTMINAATGVVKVSAAAATIIDAAARIVGYTFVAAEVDTPGIYWTSFVETVSGETDTFPAEPSEGLIYINGDTPGTKALEAYHAAGGREY